MIRKFSPQDFLWRLSTLNIIVITAAILLSGLAIYNTACALVGSMGGLNDLQQARFNSLLFNYLLIFISVTIVSGSLLQYYVTKKLVNPVQKLIESTKQMREGEYPDPVSVSARGEIGELAGHFNGLVAQLKSNDEDRNKLISDLSHELRTPLTNLNGYLKALRDGDIQGDEELYDALLNESKRLTEMTEQMELLKEWGETASHHYTKLEFMNITELTEQCVEMFQLELERNNIPLMTDMEDYKFKMNADGVQQVVTNLIDNAVNHHHGTAPIEVKGRMQNRFYQVSVSGPGPVIPANERERIFERLYRLDTSRNRGTGGSGLGLAIVKEIINKHEGETGVSSEDGINTFWFTLPVK